MWTWFHDPRAVEHEGHTFITWHQDAGIWVGDLVDGSWTRARLATTATENDHHVAALGVRPDGRLIACYTEHNRSLRCRLTTRPSDVSSWGEETVIDGGSCTYPNLVHLEAERRWLLFYRRTADRKHKPMMLRTSDDDGETWSAETELFDVEGHRPYAKVASDGRSRVDVAVTDGHPNEYAANSIYHFAYAAGRWVRSDGTDMGDPPFGPADATLVHDATRQDPAWVWDVAPGPVIAFATFPTRDEHRYGRARWDGSRWVVHDVAAGGTTIDVTGTEDHYSGGVVLDHARPDRMVASVQDRDGWVLKRFTVSDDGEVSDVEVLSETGGKHVRPVVVRGGHRVCWLAGSYDGYKHFETRLRAHPPLAVEP